jgi:16S rRNA G527 N7-methylase RsmG
MREYDLITDWYPSDRGRSVGVREGLAAVASLPREARILDVGCGNGFPITDALVSREVYFDRLDRGSKATAAFLRS